MTFPKHYMNWSELVAEGFPACILSEIWNKPGQEIAVKGLKSNSPIVFDTVLLNKELTKRTKLDQARRGL